MYIRHRPLRLLALTTILIITLSYLAPQQLKHFQRFMSFKDILAQAKLRAEGFASLHRSHHPAPPVPSNKPAAPPIPPNKPSISPNSAYWTPSFDASTPVSHHFKHQLGAHGWGNNELQNYVDAPANSFHADGRLIIRAIVSGRTYTSARLTSHTTLNRQRGSLTTTVTPPCAVGIWPALWMLPAEPFQWPYEGEVDILETWNADMVQHSCLHWGHFDGKDYDKHRVVETNMPDMCQKPHTYEFAWEQAESGQGGKMLWYIDGRAVMKANIPQGTRRMSDWQIIINVAMGGNVCQGKTPAAGQYDMIIHSLKLSEEPTGGWGRFEADWRSTREGHTS